MIQNKFIVLLPFFLSIPAILFGQDFDILELIMEWNYKGDVKEVIHYSPFYLKKLKKGRNDKINKEYIQTRRESFNINDSLSYRTETLENKYSNPNDLSFCDYHKINNLRVKCRCFDKINPKVMSAILFYSYNFEDKELLIENTESGGMTKKVYDKDLNLLKVLNWKKKTNEFEIHKEYIYVNNRLDSENIYRFGKRYGVKEFVYDNQNRILQENSFNTKDELVQAIDYKYLSENRVRTDRISKLEYGKYKNRNVWKRYTEDTILIYDHYDNVIKELKSSGNIKRKWSVKQFQIVYH